MNPYGPPSKTPSKSKKLCDQAGRPVAVPNLDDVQAFMSEPDYVEQPKSELETLLASQHIQNPYPYPGDTALLPSYSSEPPESTYAINLREQVKHALANAWKYDPIGCSVKAAFQVARDLPSIPNHSLAKQEHSWTTGGKLTTVKKARNAARIDFEQARKQYEWIKSSDEDDEILNFTGTIIDQELDEFYGPDGTDLRPIDNGSDDEGFCEPDTIVTTTFSLPDKSLLEEGVTPGGIFQDSGISMDEGYAEYSLAHSLPNTAKEITGMVPSDWPTFNADVASLRVPFQRGRWLGLVGDQKQCEWPGRRQGPYDLDGLHSWVHASNSDHVEILNKPEAGSNGSQDMAGSFTPQPVVKETSVGRDIEAAVSQDVDATGARFTAALAVAETRDADQMVDIPIVDTTYESPLPAKVTLSIESVERAQEVSEPVEGKVNDKPSEPTPQLLGQEQSHFLHGNNNSGRFIENQERFHELPTSEKETDNNKTSEVVPQLVSEERSQHFPGSIENGSDNEPSVSAPHVIGEVPQIQTDVKVHVRRNILTTPFTTPVNQRIRQVQKVQVDTPATPATVNINLTPEYDSDMDADDASDGSLEVGLPSSPTIDTQKGQSALGRYVQETKSQPNLALQGSSTVSLDGSESEEVLLIPTQQRPSPPEGHAGFSKGVELHQKKSDAVFTLGTPKASHETPSSSKAAHIPATPANGEDSTSLRPTTPFQHDDRNHRFDSPSTPTPASKPDEQPRGDSSPSKKSVMKIFQSPKLGIRSPERARPSPEITVAPTTPAAGAGAGDRYRGSPFGGQGLLFQKAKKNERDTKNVLNSLKLSPERGSGHPVREVPEDYGDELAGEEGVEVYKEGKGGPETRGPMGSRFDLGARGGRKVAQAVVVPSVRSRDEDDGGQTEGVQSQEPRKKKLRRSTRGVGGADVPDAGPMFEHREGYRHS